MFNTVSDSRTYLHVPHARSYEAVTLQIMLTWIFRSSITHVILLKHHQSPEMYMTNSKKIRCSALDCCRKQVPRSTMPTYPSTHIGYGCRTRSACKMEQESMCHLMQKCSKSP
jgi:hypothetical protein